MFHSARLTLTAWYLLIIMVISISFSLVIYRINNDEFERGFRRMQTKYQQRFLVDPGLPPPQFIDPDYIKAAEQRLLDRLILINLIILIFSAGAGYFLAGRTLQPIKEMMEEQSRFIADASHEMHTPLTAAKTSIEVGLRDKNLTLKEAKQLLVSNLEDIDTMHALTNNLLYLAQGQNGSGLSLEKIQLKTIILDALKQVNILAKTRGITIKNAITNYRVLGDKSSLVKVFVILLDNAIKYSPEKSTIKVQSGRNDGTISVSVTDQGIGIDKRDIQYIFNRFYRTDKSRTKTETSGFGLGLSIAKKILESQSGSISVVSKAGKGSTFTVNLPHQK